MKEQFWIADIHTHILPEIDDGATSVKMSMEMIADAYQQGVRVIYATSHNYPIRGENSSKRLREIFAKIKELCQEVYPDLKLNLGMEIYCTPEEMDSHIQNLDAGIYPTMNGSGYVLAEFSHHTVSYEEMKKCLQTLIDNQYIPIIAHAERYRGILTSMEQVKELKDMGCLIQINVYSIAEEPNMNIRRLAHELLQGRYVDFLGSDAHRTTHRPPKLLTGVKVAMELYGEEYARKIAWENVGKIPDLLVD